MQKDNELKIDLSQVRYHEVAPKPADIDGVKACLQVYKTTMQEALNTRFELMQHMGVALNSRIELAPGQDHPAMDIRNRIVFLDKVLKRLTDLIDASWVVIHHDPSDEHDILAAFPAMKACVPEAIKTIIANRDKTNADTIHAEAMLIAGFADLRQYLRPLRTCELLA